MRIDTASLASRVPAGTLLSAGALTAGLLSALAACGPGDVPPAEAASIPLYVVDQDPVTVTPFQTTRTVTNGFNASVSFPVPAGERLVIRFISGSCSLTNGVPLHSVRVSTSVSHFIAPSHVIPPATTGNATLTHETVIFANPGTNVNLQAFPTTNTATTTCTVSVSGYLVTP